MTVSQGGSTEDVKLQQLRDRARVYSATLTSTKPMSPSHPSQPSSAQHQQQQHQQVGDQSGGGGGRRSDAIPHITTTALDSRAPLTGPSTATSSTTASTASMNLVKDPGPVRGSTNPLHPIKPSNSQSGSFRRQRRNSKASPDHTPSCASSLKNSQLLAEPVKFMMGGGGDESGDEADHGSTLSPIPHDTTRLSPAHSSQSISHNSNVSPAPPSTQQGPVTRLNRRRSFRSAHRNSFPGDSFSAGIPEHGGERDPASASYNGDGGGDGRGDDHELSDGSLVFGFGTLLDEPQASHADNGPSPTSVSYETADTNTSPVGPAGHARFADRRSSSGAASATPTQGKGPLADGGDEEDDPIMRKLHTDDPDPNQLPVPKKPLDLQAALPDYTLKKTLGEGAFAKVKQAIHKASGISVAIKIIFKDSITADYVRDNLRREGELLRQLNHPHVIKLFEIVETDDIYCLVTELATGGEVLDYIVAHGSLSEKEVRKYCRQMIQAIDHLHQADVVHRDLKTENLLLDHHLNLKLVDFGLSNSIKGKTSLTTMCGSPAYTAPELLGGKQYGKPVDIWSIGVNMYAMLTGKLPFSSHNVTTLHAMILDQQYTIPDKISEECKDLLTKLLVAKPKDRISMEDLRNHPWLAQSEGPIAADPGPAGRKLEINNDITDHMVALGHDREEVLEAIEANWCNTHYACYHLLAVRLERTGHLSTRGPSATRTRGRLTRATTDVNLKALNSSKNTLEFARTGRSPHRVSSGHTGRRQSISALRPPRPKHSHTRGSRSPHHRPHAEPAQPRHSDAKKLTDGGGTTVNTAGTTAATTTTPGRPFHRSFSSTDGFTRRRSSFRRASTDQQPPVLAEVDKEEDGPRRGEGTPSRRHRTKSTRVYRKSFTLEGSLGETSTNAGLAQHADGSSAHKQGGGGRTPTNAHTRTSATGAAATTTKTAAATTGNESAGSQGRRATLHTTNRKALLKSLCRAHDDPPTPSTGQAPSTVTPEELSADLNATLNSAAGTRRRSSTSRRSFRNGSTGPSLPPSTTGSSKDILPDIPTGMHPSQQRPLSSTASPRVRSGSLRRRSGERRPSTSSNANLEPTIQSIRYPLNRRMVSAKSPSEIYKELQRALLELDIQYRPCPDTPMGVVCRYKNVRLEAEVVQIAGLSMHGVHMQRQRGDLETYAEVCTNILNEMNL